MSGVELLSFACNIMQVISFSREVISLCSNIYQGKHPDEKLTELAFSLQVVSSDVQTRFDAIQPKTADERRLCEIATRCVIAARDLEEEVGFITSRQQQGSLASTLRVAAKTTWRKRRLDRLEKALQERERVLNTSLLARVCNQTDAIEIKQKQVFEELRGDIQHFVSQYALGHKELPKLVQSNTQWSQRTSEKIMKQEFARSQAAMFSHIDSQAEVAAKITTQRLHDLEVQSKGVGSCNRFLQSLKYPAMNERRNHLTDSHEGTFKWVFRQCKHSDDDVNTDNSDKSSDDEDDENYDDPPWDNLREWLKSESDIYWISGKPGSGKSTMMKFLGSNPCTREALLAWRSNVTIISHFFWKPGSRIQRNLKGLFASLLHQLLSLQEGSLRSILTTSWDFKQKDSDTDWSVTELQQLCLSTIRQYPTSLCIFIDGLDEMCDEDRVDVLMGFLNTIKSTPGVKVCVASRPEQRFKLYLSHVPQMKVHDLTSSDIKHYADQTLRCLWDRRQDLPHSTLDEILWILTHKAQGVFLWIRLAVKNVVRGLENGDSRSELLLRLHELPTDLSRMYADMWTRLNGDTEVYRESTATLFNLITVNRELQDHLWQHGYTSDPVRVVDIMGATELLVQKGLFVDGQKPTTDTVLKLCTHARELIEVRCIGLVDIRRHRVPSYVTKPYDESLLPHVELNVDFIHRTAYDFLTDTEEGQRILSYDSSSKEETYLQLFKGHLVGSAIMGHEPLHVLLKILARASHFLPPEMTNNLLKLCWKLYNRALIRRRSSYFNQCGPHFLAFTVLPEFEDFVVASINKSQRPSALATEVLRDTSAFFIPTRCSLFHFRSLKSLGADPNLKGRAWRTITAISNNNGSFFARSIRPLQGLIQDLAIGALRKGGLHMPGELMDLYEAQDAILNELSYMSVDLSDDRCFFSSDIRYFEGQKNFWDTARETVDCDKTWETSIFIETKTAFLLEIARRRYGHHYMKATPTTPPTVLEDTIQGHSCIRVLYLTFSQAVEKGSSKLKGCCRVQNRESTEDVEQLIKSWLLNEIELSSVKPLLKEAVKRVYNDVVAGSFGYERIHGDIREYMADEASGISRIPRKEIDERARYMREEDPEHPGHWL